MTFFSDRTTDIRATHRYESEMRIIIKIKDGDRRQHVSDGRTMPRADGTSFFDNSETSLVRHRTYIVGPRWRHVTESIHILA